MKFIQLLFWIGFSYCLTLSWAHAVDDLDWTFELQPIYEAGPDTPSVGKRWTLGSVREGVFLTFQLDAQTDMMRGNWHGDIRAQERFYINLNYVDEAGNRFNLQPEEVQAIGPDAEYGIWKKGPATAKIQALRFDFTRDKLMTLKDAKSVIINYASFDAPNEKHDIIFPMDSFKSRLVELDNSIKDAGGHAFTMTTTEIENQPIKDLPLAIQMPTKASMTEVSKNLSIAVTDLMSLSISQVKAKIEDKQVADRAAARAAKRAEHQLIYDQEPNWMDLNLCPKPDVNLCKHVGKEAYENSILLGGDFSYGDIKGVVWRSKGSIVRIYGGAIDLDIDPEIYRAKSAQYYYIVQNDEGQLDIRPSEGMLIR